MMWRLHFAIIICASLAVGAASTSAVDAGEERPRVALEQHKTANRPNIFEKLFGKTKPKTAKIKVSSVKRKVSKPKAAVRQQPTPDPQLEPGLGMGNLVYVPPALFRLGCDLQAEKRPVDQMAASLFDALTSHSSEVRVRLEIRDALVAHYQSTEYKLIWIQNGALTDRGLAVLEVLKSADAEGLSQSDYKVPSLSVISNPQAIGDIQQVARADLEISAMALSYALDASGGRYDPRSLSAYFDVVPEHVMASTAMKVLAWSPFAAEYLRGLHPDHSAYTSMKQALADLRAQINVVPLQYGPTIRLGHSDPRVQRVRQRLAQLGYGQHSKHVDDSEILDAELSNQIRSFQRDHGLKPSGNIGRSTITALNGSQNTREKIQTLLVNMERVRWLPKSLGRRHVFINQPEFQARVVDGERVIWSGKTIIGKPLTQTYLFHDEVETVVFNPSWGVPPSIIANSYLPKLRRDPGYLDRKGYRVVSSTGELVPSRSVRWSTFQKVAEMPYSIIQPAGPKNPLGELKFLFPNEHHIYLHDTPEKSLFARDERVFSHGCVRVENPREFASALLEWEATKVDAMIDNAETRGYRLEEKLPIHLVYFTAWPDNRGQIQFFRDLYERDLFLVRAMKGSEIAMQ